MRLAQKRVYMKLMMRLLLLPLLPIPTNQGEMMNAKHAAVAYQVPRSIPATVGPTLVCRLSTTKKRANRDQPFYVTFQELSHSPGCIATITMNNPRANTFDQQSLDALNDAVSEAEANKRVRGLVLESAVAGFFSGGFNLSVFQQITDAEFTRLWAVSKAIFRRIHALPVPSVAAINGHALGLGFVFAMACQFRYMVRSDAQGSGGKKLVGLNEVTVGLPIPEWLVLRFRDLTTPRTAEDLLATGAMLSASSAHGSGLVDRLFSSSAEMHTAIVADLSRRAMVPHEAQKQTIALLRSDYLSRFDACNERDNRFFWDAVSSTSTQQAIEGALAKLKARK
ncbi:hypothetical protein IW138_002208 [Coemansia sp. RSA 986]|nr:hypothetical protein IW138_002208 [Coemansia sp. RSA 986]